MSSLNNWDGEQLLNDLLNDTSDVKSHDDQEIEDVKIGSTSKNRNTSRRKNEDGAQSDEFYQLLGVSKKATKKEIKRAYRAKARVVHPDRNTKMSREDAETAFHDLTFAYKTLMDDKLREIYDKFGKGAIDGKLNIDITKINIMNLFDQLYDEDDENKQRKPPALMIMTEYDEDDLLDGIKIQSFDRKEICDMCKGKGTRKQGGKCDMCGGKGFIVEKKTLKVKVSSDDVSKKNKTYPGMGDMLIDYPERGDLVLRLRYRPKGRYVRHKQSIKANDNMLIKDGISVTISLNDALYGLNKTFETAQGKLINVDIPAPIQPGSKHDIEGLMVTFNVEIPNLKQCVQSISGKNGVDINGLCPGFEVLMQHLHEQQQASLDAANRKAKENTKSWCRFL